MATMSAIYKMKHTSSTCPTMIWSKTTQLIEIRDVIIKSLGNKLSMTNVAIYKMKHTSSTCPTIYGVKLHN
jgi:hypothetical protein